MEKISFENAELCFNDFHIGTLNGEIEIKGTLNSAVRENFDDGTCVVMQTPDLVLRFDLREKSQVFSQAVKSVPPPPDLQQMLTDFGTLKIKNPDGNIVYIHDAYWSFYPSTAFQIKRNSANMLHTVYFLGQIK